MNTYRVCVRVHHLLPILISKIFDAKMRAVELKLIEIKFMLSTFFRYDRIRIFRINKRIIS